jgi:hypothetical protein
MGNNIWDDPEWDKLRSRVNGGSVSKGSRKQKIPNTVKDTAYAKKPVPEVSDAPEEAKKVNLSLNLTLPKVKIPKISKKQLKIGLASFAIIAASVAGSILIINNRDKADEPTDVLADVATEPEFDTVLPDGKREETASGKIGYDPKRKVASFTDTLDTATITVSQQELPEPFKTNPDEEVKKLAEGFSATEVINESNPKAFLGNDVSGAQTVIFHKKGLLVFILSNKPVEKDLWAEYITKLL